MTLSHILNECFTKYKIEKWNEKKECWEFVNHYITYNNARYHYRELLLTNKGIFRLISVIELMSNLDT